jgi:hypothetical protein
VALSPIIFHPSSSDLTFSTVISLKYYPIQPLFPWPMVVAPVFSSAYEGVDGKLRLALTHPIVNREIGKYLGLVVVLVPTVEFF